LPAPGIGLFGDPREVVRVAVDDRARGDAAEDSGKAKIRPEDDEDEQGTE